VHGKVRLIEVVRMLPVLRFVCHAQNTSIVSRCWRAM
jgi:hypothetical protein